MQISQVLSSKQNRAVEGASPYMKIGGLIKQIKAQEDLSCAFFMRKKRTALIRKPSLMLSEILLCNKCQSISCNEKLFVCWDNVNLCLRLVSGDLLEDSTAEILLSVNVDTEDIEI